MSKVNGSELVIENLQSYGEYFNEERGIISIYSGLKPVQQKILWGAYQIGLKKDKVKKGINLTGATMSYYVHGDNPLHSAIVRMGQDFKMTYPLLKIVGHKGGQSLLTAKNSGAAAMRYLEVGLTELGEQFLNSVKNGTAKMGRNFDNTLDEPVHLFVPFPYFLMANQKGIGVGTSSSIPSFKKKSVIELTEKLMRNPNLSFNEIAEILEPFFIQGATVVNKNELAEVYSHMPRDGKKSSIKFRATFKQVGNVLTVTNFPFSASPTIVIQEIETQIEKGNKVFNLIQRVQDTTSLTSKGEEIVSMEFTLKQKTDAEELTRALCEFTSLQSYANINLVMLDRNDRVKEFNIKTALLEWIEIFKEKTTEKLEHEKKGALEKVNILSGLIYALDEIDEIINLIKSSESKSAAKTKLVQRGYNLDQAEAILEMKLAKLANLEYEELVQKRDELTSKIVEIDSILSDDLKMKEIMIAEMSTFKKADYSTICKVIDSELIKISAGKSDNFYIQIQGTTVKTTDEIPKTKHYAGNKENPVYIFAGSDVIPIKGQVKDGSIYGVLHILSGSSDVFHVDKSGYVKRTQAEEFKVTKKSSATKLSDTVFVTQEADILVVTTNKGKKYQSKLSDIKTTGRATKGSNIFKLKDEEIVKAELRKSYVSGVPKC